MANPAAGLLRVYLEVEAIAGNDEVILSFADDLWYRLSDDDQDWLRARGHTRPGVAPTVEEPAPEGGTRLVLLP